MFTIIRKIGTSRTVRMTCCFFALMTVNGCSSSDQIKPLKPVRVATGNWEPFVGENLPHNGPLAEMISTVLVDLGYVPEFKFYDWPMVEIHLKTGNPGLAFPYIKSNDRLKEGFQYSDPLYTFEYVLFYHKDREKEFSLLTSLDQIMKKGLHIGRIRGYTKLPAISDKNTYIPVSSTVEGFQLLRKSATGSVSKTKKIDFLLESKIVGLRTLKSQDISQDKDEFKYLGQNGKPELISKASLRVMLSPKYDETLVKKINKAIHNPDNQQIFDSVSERIKATSLDTAYLSANVDKAIFGYKNAENNGARYLLPRNSRVLVVKWGSAYTEAVDSNSNDQVENRSLVKLLSGPLRGKLVWVNNVHITLEH